MTRVTKEAIERIAADTGQPVLEVIRTLQAGAARLGDGEATLEALIAIKNELLSRTSCLCVYAIKDFAKHGKHDARCRLAPVSR
jgi:hypothetical protein